MKTCLNRNTLALLSLFLTLLACTYEPEEKYFKEIPQTEPVVSLSLNSYDDADTIYLWGDGRFTYSLNVGPGDLEKIEILINNSVIRTTQERNGTFSIQRYGENYSWFKTGTYELKLQFVASSGTGSLADQVGAEKLQVWRTWVLIIDAEPPPTPVITFSEENGFLKLSWDTYTKPNFERYVIHKTDENGNLIYKEFRKSEQNYWIDSTYIGGYSRIPEYQLWIVSAINSSNSNTTYKYDPISFTGGKLDLRDSTITVKWTKTKYYGALAAYSLKHQETELYRGTDANDTTVTIKLKSIIFGDECIIYMNAVPKYKTNYYPSNNLSIKVMLGTRQMRDGTITYNIDRNQYICYSSVYGTQPYFYMYSPEMEPVDSIPTVGATPHMPTRGQYVYYDRHQEYGMIDLDTKSTKTHIAPTQLGNFRGTSNGLVNYDYVFSSFGRLVYATVVYDVINDDIIFSDGQYTSISSVVSDDGNFIRAKPVNRFLKVGNGTTTETGSLGSSNEFLGFRPDNCNEIFIRNGNFIYIRDSSSPVSILRSIQLPFTNSSFTYASYDPVSKYMVWQDASTHTIYLVNVDTGATKTLKSYGTKLINGTLFYGGYYLKII